MIKLWICAYRTIRFRSSGTFLLSLFPVVCVACDRPEAPASDDRPVVGTPIVMGFGRSDRLSPRACSYMVASQGSLTAGTIVASQDTTIDLPHSTLLPSDLAKASDESLLLADRSDYRVAHLDATGRVLQSWGRRGGGPGEFSEISAIASDRHGNVYVAEPNGRMQIFAASGTLLRTFNAQGIDDLSDLIVLPNGNIVIATRVEVPPGTISSERPYVVMLNPEGDLVRPIAILTAEKVAAFRPFMVMLNEVRLALGPAGQFAVWYPIDNYVEVYDPAGAMMGRIEGCLPDNLRSIYEAYDSKYGRRPEAEVILTLGVGFDGPDRIKVASVYNKKGGRRLRIRTYALNGSEIDVQDFDMPHGVNSINNAIFDGPGALIGFSSYDPELGVGRVSFKAVH